MSFINLLPPALRGGVRDPIRESTVSPKHPTYYSKTKVQQHAEHNCIQSISTADLGLCEGDPKGFVFQTSTTVTDLTDRGPSISPIGSICSANYYPLLCHSYARCRSMSLNATLSMSRTMTKENPCLFFFPLGASQAFASRLVTSQVFKDTKRVGRAVGRSRGGGQLQERMTCQMRKKTFWKGQSGRKRKHIELMEKYNLLTICLSGWQQPSSVFLEPYNIPNYSVRKIKESQRAVEWKKRGAKLSQRVTNGGETFHALFYLKTCGLGKKKQEPNSSLEHILISG